jgi:hypothetical protein
MSKYSEKMLAAANNLKRVVAKKPYAGGILAFAQHLNGHSELAEKTAKAAIKRGYNDPW